MFCSEFPITQKRSAGAQDVNRRMSVKKGEIYEGIIEKVEYPNRGKVFVDGQEVRLTQTEYNIVAFLSEHAGRVMTYAAIVRAIWGDTDASSTKKLQVNMANIRKKLGSRPGSNTYILNELGVGYRMIEEDAKPLEPAEETK